MGDRRSIPPSSPAPRSWLSTPCSPLPCSPPAASLLTPNSQLLTPCFPLRWKYFGKYRFLTVTFFDLARIYPIGTIRCELSAILFESLTTEAIPEILACGESAASSKAQTCPGQAAPTYPRAKADREEVSTERNPRYGLFVLLQFDLARARQSNEPAQKSSAAAVGESPVRAPFRARRVPARAKFAQISVGPGMLIRYGEWEKRRSGTLISAN